MIINCNFSIDQLNLQILFDSILKKIKRHRFFNNRQFQYFFLQRHQIKCIIYIKQIIKQKTIKLMDKQQSWKKIFLELGQDWNQEQINLQNMNLNDTIMQQLAKAPLTNLKILSIESNQVTDLGILTFLSNKNLPNLRMLSISQNKIKDSLLEIFKKKFDAVVLNRNEINGNSFANCVKCEFTLPKSLSLGRNKIGSIGIKLLIKGDMSKIEKLNLSQCYIGNEGVKHLTKANYKALKGLFIYQSETNTSTEYLSMQCCQNLHELIINVDAISLLTFAAVNFFEDFRIPDLFREKIKSKTLEIIKNMKRKQ